MDGQGPIFTGQDLPTLRKPNISLEETELSAEDLHKNDSKSTDSIVSKSKLSAEAKEFVPKGIYSPNTNTQPTNKSVQNRLNRSQQPQMNIVIVSPPLPQEMNNGPILNDYFTFGIEHLHEVITLLTSDPGKFDERVPLLVDDLRTCLDDTQMMDAVVSNIVDQAIAEHNFGYSGARLFVLLNAYSPPMRLCLMQHCETIQFSADHSDKARNYTLFLAELFSQLDWEEPFGQYLLRMLQVLLTFNEPDDIKCICQTLKLTGMSLEALHFDEVLSIVNRLQERLPELPSSCANLLKSVLDLRSAQWGRSMHPPPVTPITHPVQSDYPPESPFAQRWSDGGTVFYGPDGLELSAEENAFLRDMDNEYNEDSDDPEALFDAEMDEEMRRAYGEFVVAQGKK